MCTAASIVYAIAGSTSQGSSGNDGSATAALFNTPHYITGDTVGHLWVADTANVNIRKLTLQVPTWSPTALPTQPTVTPSISPSIVPTVKPTIAPTESPTVAPTMAPSVVPTINPSAIPTIVPTAEPSIEPSLMPTMAPSLIPSIAPSVVPSHFPSAMPTGVPSRASTSEASNITMVIGIVVGAVGLIALVAGGFYYFKYSKQFKMKAYSDSKVIPTEASDGVLVQVEEGNKVQSFATLTSVSASELPQSSRSVSVSPELAGKVIKMKDLPAELHPMLPKAVDSMTFKQIVDALKDKTDVFLTHNWGKDQANHKRVAEVNQKLQSLGFRTWFDSDKMKGSVQEQMSKGIDNASCIVVFITQDYIKKVDSDNDNDNCKLEFGYAGRRKTKKLMIPVVMESQVTNTETWEGNVGMILGGVLYVNMCDSINEDNIKELHDRIMEKIDVKIKTLLDECEALVKDVPTEGSSRTDLKTEM